MKEKIEVGDIVKVYFYPFSKSSPIPDYTKIGYIYEETKHVYYGRYFDMGYVDSFQLRKSIGLKRDKHNRILVEILNE